MQVRKLGQLRPLPEDNLPPEAWRRAPGYLLRRIGRVASIALAGALLSATLVRCAPGFGVDDRELDSRFSSRSLESIRQSRNQDQWVIKFYAHYLNNLLRGDFGRSESFERPIADLLRERAKVSLKSLARTLPITWILVLGLAIVSAADRSRAVEFVPSFVAGVLMATPAAVIALWAATAGRGTGMALTLVLAPTLYRYARNFLQQSFQKLHVIAARARGISLPGLIAWHVLPSAAPQLVGLMAVSVSMAFGSLIPIETLCDSPGIGQLAMQAALGRDLPLLVTLTFCVATATSLANTLAEGINEALTPVSA